MDITSLIIEAVSGAVGGNVAGAAMKENSLGTAGNSIAGILGGGLGGTILHSVMGTAAAGGGGMDLQSILTNVGGGGVGGAILMAVVGIIKNKMAQKERGRQIGLPTRESPLVSCYSKAGLASARQDHVFFCPTVDLAAMGTGEFRRFDLGYGPECF